MPTHANPNQLKFIQDEVFHLQDLEMLPGSRNRSLFYAIVVKKSV
jgi:hypothetical protein